MSAAGEEPFLLVAVVLPAIDMALAAVLGLVLGWAGRRHDASAPAPGVHALLAAAAALGVLAVAGVGPRALVLLAGAVMLRLRPTSGTPRQAALLLATLVVGIACGAESLALAAVGAVLAAGIALATRPV